MYKMLTDLQSIEAAAKKLTAKGRPVIEAIGTQRVSFFDNGVAPDSGIWSEQLAQETGVLSGVLNGLVKQGLATITTHPGEDSWFDLTPLGADVANHLAGNLAPATAEPVVEDLTDAEAISFAEETTPAPVAKMTKTDAYELVKRMRIQLRDADEAIYRGTEDELESAMAQLAAYVRTMQDTLSTAGVNCGK